MVTKKNAEGAAKAATSEINPAEAARLPAVFGMAISESALSRIARPGQGRILRPLDNPNSGLGQATATDLDDDDDAAPPALKPSTVVTAAKKETPADRVLRYQEFSDLKAAIEANEPLYINPGLDEKKRPNPVPPLSSYLSADQTLAKAIVTLRLVYASVILDERNAMIGMIRQRLEQLGAKPEDSIQMLKKISDGIEQSQGISR